MRAAQLIVGLLIFIGLPCLANAQGAVPAVRALDVGQKSYLHAYEYIPTVPQGAYLKIIAVHAPDQSQQLDEQVFEVEVVRPSEAIDRSDLHRLEVGGSNS